MNLYSFSRCSQDGERFQACQKFFQKMKKPRPSSRWRRRTPSTPLRRRPVRVVADGKGHGPAPPGSLLEAVDQEFPAGRHRERTKCAAGFRLEKLTEDPSRDQSAANHQAPSTFQWKEPQIGPAKAPIASAPPVSLQTIKMVCPPPGTWARMRPASVHRWAPPECHIQREGLLPPGSPVTLASVDVPPCLNARTSTPNP